MASKMEKTSGSRLTQMQARFQQKQLQERELKIASLYEAQQARALDRVRHSPSTGASKTAATQEPPISVHPGKVRQMFEERRTKAGIDKSYPLQPIHNNDRRKPAASGPNKPAVYNNGVNRSKTQENGPSRSISNANSRNMENKKRVANTTSRVGIPRHREQKVEALANGSGDLNHNHGPDLNKNIKQNLSRSNGELIPGIDALDRADNNYLLENETPPPALAASPPPSRTPHSPPTDAPRRPPRRNGVKEVQQVRSPQQPVAPPRKANSDYLVSGDGQTKKGMQCSDNALPKRKPVLNGIRAGVRASIDRKTAAASASAAALKETPGVPCSVCGRRFAADRLQRHEEICRRASTKKRKPFDALKHRLAGTEAEQFINKIRRQGNSNTSSTKLSKPLNSTWRQKHEEFIAAIRAAKQVQAHINAGGKLSDLPPPPRSENPDYVQCPHCQRRFNETAAERHIPKCASYQFNKSKAGPAKHHRR